MVDFKVDFKSKVDFNISFDEPNYIFFFQF